MFPNSEAKVRTFMKVIGVRFKSGGRIYYFDPLDYAFCEGDGVIVETARGQEYGEVTQTAIEVEETALVSPLKPVVRPATDQDATLREQNSAKEGDAFAVCQQKIAQHGLDMRLVSAEYSFNGSKLVFYFTADERVDFRELVKDLASQFRTRIELRQIGVRDEAKMLGGLGSCGRPVCCKSFLEDFRPVSIKMAKEQNLSLSPTKISGLCGRLMCCLQYEQSSYEEMKKRMPRVGKEIQTPDGNGMVVENNAITEKTKVRVTLPDGTIDLREYHYTALARPGEPLPVQPVAAQSAQTQPKAEDPRIFVPAKPCETEPAKAAGESAASEQQGQGASKRRRRGGRGHGNKPAQNGDAAAPSQRPQDGNQPREQHEKPSAENGGAQPGQTANKRRRRGGRGHGGANGGTNNGGANGDTKREKTE